MSDKPAPSARVQLSVEGPTAGAELAVYDSSFKLVNSGIGEIAVPLPAGLYDVEARIANGSERKSVALVGPPQRIAAGEWSLKLRTAAPLPLSSTWRQSHQEAAARYSKETTASAEGNSRLLVFARGVKRGPTGEWAKLADKFWAGMKLTRADRRLVSDLTHGVASDVAQGWCAFSVDLAEGGYVVSAPSANGGETCMPLWLQPGYGTYVFVPVFDRAALDGASIVMAPKAEGFRPENQAEAEYAEALLAGFRRDKDLVNSSTIQKMLARKIDNPFAGIVAAYALLRSEDKSGVSTHVIGDLRGMLGHHPDVLALELMSQRRSDVALSFPPNLRVGFDAVIAGSASNPNVLLVNELITEALGGLLPGQYTFWHREPSGAGQLLPTLRDQFAKVVQGISAVSELVRRGGVREVVPVSVDIGKTIDSFEAWIATQDARDLASKLGLPPVVIEKVKGRLKHLLEVVRRLTPERLRTLELSLPAGFTDAVRSRLVRAIDSAFLSHPGSALDRRVVQLIVRLWDQERKPDSEFSADVARCRRRLELLAGNALKAHDLIKSRADGGEDAMMVAAMLAGLAARLYPFLLAGRELDIKVAAGWFTRIEGERGQSGSYLGAVDRTPLGPAFARKLTRLLHGGWLSSPQAAELTPVMVRNGVELRFLNLQAGYWVAVVETFEARLAADVSLAPPIAGSLDEWIDQQIIALAEKIERYATGFIDLVRDASDPMGSSGQTKARERLADMMAQLRARLQHLISDTGLAQTPAVAAATAAPQSMMPRPTQLPGP